MRTRSVILLSILQVTIPLFACSSDAGRPEPDRGILWVRDAAEFDAVAMQVYRAASDDLAELIADRSWTALPGQRNYGQLPPAIVIDVDETLISNTGFQASFEPPFTNAKHNEWHANNASTPVPGAPAFVRLAREQGVEVFFVTNRPCEPIEGVSEPCPQEAVTVADLVEAGIPADSDNVMLANERPEWDREKVIRRNLIAQDYRIVMVIGDDLSDFIPCVRKKILEPCAEAATLASREKQTELYERYWGAGWYVLPNPMHGSWTTIE